MVQEETNLWLSARSTNQEDFRGNVLLDIPHLRRRHASKIRIIQFKSYFVLVEHFQSAHVTKCYVLPGKAVGVHKPKQTRPSKFGRRQRARQREREREREGRNAGPAARPLLLLHLPLVEISALFSPADRPTRPRTHTPPKFFWVFDKTQSPREREKKDPVTGYVVGFHANPTERRETTLEPATAILRHRHLRENEADSCSAPAGSPRKR